MKTIIVFLADGFEMIEALSPVDYLRRANLNVITVAVPSTTMQKENLVVSSHKVPVIADMSFNEYIEKFSENLPDCVICPGGSVGAVNLSNYIELTEHLEKCCKEEKFVCAICASPAVVLGKTNVLSGKKWTCYPGMKGEALKEYQDFHIEERVVIDKNVVTSCGAGSSEEFSLALVALLSTEDEKNRISKACCLR